MRPARVWARTVGGYRVREQNGNEEIVTPDGGGRWIVRARFSVYGYPVAVGLVDEAWNVDPEVVEDGVEPTLGDRVDPQLWLLSTAHRRATSLFPLRREAAMGEADDPGTSFLVEWSAPAGTPIEDRDAWRAASPYWSPQRERLLTAKIARVARGVSVDPDEDDPVESFRAQYLNVWPRRTLVTSTTEEPLVSREEWTAAIDLSAVFVAGEPVAVAVEDWFGLGASVAVVGGLPDGRFLVVGNTFGDRDEALGWAAWVVDDRAGSVVVAGASVSVDVVRDAIPDVSVEKSTPAGQRSGLALVRMLVRQGRLIHGGDAVLADQLAKTRVAQREGGLVIPHRAHRTDLVRAMSAALRTTVEGSSSVPSARPAIY